MVPGGAGCVMLDAAYDAYENYRVIRYSGRRPVIDPRKDHTLKGYNPRAEMLRWRKENPEEFERAYHRRSLVESVFSSLKARFGAVVAAKTLPLQRLQLILRSICYNSAVVVKLHEPDACPCLSARYAALFKPVPVGAATGPAAP